MSALHGITEEGGMKTILVADNDPVSLHLLVGMLKSHTNFLNVIAADSITNTLETLNQEAVDLVITGMHIPEPDAFQLSLLLSGHPDLRIIVITTGASEIFRSKIKTLPSVIHFDQMVDLRLLVKRILTELQIECGGQIQGLSLASLLQVLEVEGRSGTLLITAKSKTGTIYLANGKPVAAKAGKMTGKAAVLHLLNWQRPVIDIDYRAPNVAVEIDLPLMNLLLESGQFMDETLSRRRNLRQHHRYECLVGVECLINGAKCQCYMQDLSEGGAYLETDQSIEIGQPIVLTLAAPTGEQPFAVNGTIVRRDGRGIGVQFDALTPSEQQMIRDTIESACLTVDK